MVRLPDNSWVQVNVNGVIGWVSTTVVTLGGSCGGIPIVVPPTQPPPPTSAPTNLPTASATALPFDTPTPTATSGGGGGNFPPINLSLIAPIGTLVVQPQPQHLNYNASPNYGTTTFTSGVGADPVSISAMSGGAVDVSYLGGSCSGFTTAAPDLRVNYSGNGSLLRLYFVGANGDATMVVNDPYGNFYCVDDSFGTVNPTIDFNNPGGGAYDIWIGSYASNTSVSGTIYITENSGNHP